jgi:hypothetical protein
MLETAGEPRAELFRVMTDACARILSIEVEKLRLGRRVAELAAHPHDPDAAAEMRRLSVRRLALVAELGELRALLRRLGPLRRGALA